MSQDAAPASPEQQQQIPPALSSDAASTLDGG